MSDVKLWQPFTNGTAFIGMGLIGDRGPEWATAYTFVSEPDYRLAIARIAQLEGERDAWYKAEAKFYDIDVPAGITDRQSAVIWMQDRIATLEAENARLLSDVNQDEGYERLKVRCAQIESALRRIMRGVDCSEQSYQYAEEALGTSAPDGNYTDSIDVPPPCDTSENKPESP